MRCRLGRTEVCCHPALGALLLLLCCVSGESLWPGLAALLFHEAGHLLLAHLLGLCVVRLEILPFGGVMTVQGLREAPWWKQVLLCLGGPAFSLLGLLLSPLLYRVGTFSFPFTQSLIRNHLLLLFINLLPVLPLDGGRMIKALLSRFLPWEGPQKALDGATYLVCFGLCLLSLIFALRGTLSLAPAYAGFFLLYAHEAEKRRPTLSYVSALIARRQRLEREEWLPVELIAVSRGAPFLQVLSAFSPAAYHRILVLQPDGMEEAAQISEKAFLDAVLENPEGRIGDMMP